MPFRAFDLVPVITSIAHDVGDPSLKISAVEAGGPDLYLGTTSGLVLHYQYHVDKHDRTAPPSSALLNYQPVSTSVVSSLCLASALELLLVLAEETLLTLHAGALTPVDGYMRHRGVTALVANPNPRTDDPFSIQVCIARRRHLLVLNVTSAGLHTVRELSAPDRVQALAISGDAVCAAAAGRYLVFRVSSGRPQPLFEYDPAQVRPMVRSVQQEEFLVLGPADLAMFALVTGTSQRPPVQLKPGLTQWTYQHPYIITSDGCGITMLSVEDEQLRQELAVPEPAMLDNFDGTLLVCAGSTVLSLCPVPWQAQVQALVQSGDLEAAVALLDSSRPADAAAGPLCRLLGLSLLAAGQNQRASQLLLQSDLQPAQLLCLVPGLSPPTAASHHAADLMAEVPALASVTEDQLIDFLRHHLQQARDVQTAADQTAVDTALVLLLVDRPADLDQFIADRQPVCDADHCRGPLVSAGLLAQLGQLLLIAGDATAALTLWDDLLQGRQAGDASAALRYMVEALARSEDPVSLRRFADSVLEADQQLGAAIFIRRPDSLPELLSSEAVCSFLKRYPAALTLYLEHQVLTRKLQSESLSTQLAGLYLDRVSQCRQLGSDASEPSDRLLALLRCPAPLRVSALLHRTLALQLDRHAAHLYSRSGEHEKALDLVARAGPAEALSFAMEVSPVADSPLRRRLLHHLLDIHLRPENDNVAAALELLTGPRAAELEPLRVLAALPDGWSASVVGPFLLSAGRRQLHRRHAALMARQLAMAERQQARWDLAAHQQRKLIVPVNAYCPVCHKPLLADSVAAYPNGVTVHPGCAADRRRCPITGQLFSV